MKPIIWLTALFFAMGWYACKKGGAPETTAIVFHTPANFPAPTYHFNTNPVTTAGFELGRKLFYEPLLSANNTISCGSCHIQTSAFTHHGHSVSHGILDRMGNRNAPPIMNMAWSKTFMWDGGIFDLDLQAIAPITNHVEMDETIANVLAKLKASAQYPPLFRKAFGSDSISSTRFLQSLSQFMLICTSSNSKYDSVMRQERGAQFSSNEKKGYTIVQQKCGGCHAEPLFTDHSFRNNGISISNTNDQGRYGITQLDEDKYKFSVPSLRNLGYTAPYMHDGRFFTLDAVLDHYSTQVQQTPNLDPLLQQNGNRGIVLTASEREAILAFLNTLNDKSFLLDKRFSEQ